MGTAPTMQIIENLALAARRAAQSADSGSSRCMAETS